MIRSMIKGKRRPHGAKKDLEIKVTREHEIMRRREEEKEHTMNKARQPKGSGSQSVLFAESLL